jgi:sugar/nucleoside kinase (ribokinase family)
MLGPIVIIDSSEIREGMLEDLKAAMKDLTHFVEAHEPRTIAYAVYLNEEGSRVTVMQAHPDSASAEFHMDVAAPVFKRLGGFLRLEGIDVFGTPSEDLLARLRRKADLLGGERVSVHDRLAGFARLTTGRSPPGVATD